MIGAACITGNPPVVGGVAVLDGGAVVLDGGVVVLDGGEVVGFWIDTGSTSNPSSSSFSKPSRRRPTNEAPGRALVPTNEIHNNNNKGNHENKIQTSGIFFAQRNETKT